MTLCPCCLSFNVQDIILVGSSGFFNHASTSVNGCCLYTIIHYGISWWGWWIGSVHRDGRPELESFKAIDTYTYSENCTNSPHVCPRMHYDCPYKGWVFAIILFECKWVYWFTHIDHMFVELCDWNFRYISQFLQVGCGPITVEMLPYSEILIAVIFAVSRDLFIIIIVWSL